MQLEEQEEAETSEQGQLTNKAMFYLTLSYFGVNALLLNIYVVGQCPLLTKAAIHGQ